MNMSLKNYLKLVLFFNSLYASVGISNVFADDSQRPPYKVQGPIKLGLSVECATSTQKAVVKEVLYDDQQARAAAGCPASGPREDSPAICFAGGELFYDESQSGLTYIAQRNGGLYLEWRGSASPTPLFLTTEAAICSISGDQPAWLEVTLETGVSLTVEIKQIITKYTGGGSFWAGNHECTFLERLLGHCLIDSWVTLDVVLSGSDGSRIFASENQVAQFERYGW